MLRFDVQDESEGGLDTIQLDLVQRSELFDEATVAQSSNLEAVDGGFLLESMMRSRIEGKKKRIIRPVGPPLRHRHHDG